MRKGFSVAVLIGLAVVCAGGAYAANSNASPFTPPSARPAPVVPTMDPALAELQLSGISVIGDQKLFNLVNPSTKEGFWLALGASENGFTVESYDSKTDAVVVRKGDFARRLELRQSKIVAAAQPVEPSALPPLKTAPDVPNVQIAGVDEIKNPKTPAEIKQAEFEARMLVSDLLEISMQERARQRALREAAKNK